MEQRCGIRVWMWTHLDGQEGRDADGHHVIVERVLGRRPATHHWRPGPGFSISWGMELYTARRTSIQTTQKLLSRPIPSIIDPENSKAVVTPLPSPSPEVERERSGLGRAAAAGGLLAARHVHAEGLVGGDGLLQALGRQSPALAVLKQLLQLVPHHLLALITWGGEGRKGVNKV